MVVVSVMAMAHPTTHLLLLRVIMVALVAF
jgi:hypothetical protein